MSRSFLLTGALIAFVLAFISGTLAGSPPANVLRDSLFAAVIGALSGKGLYAVLLSSLKTSQPSAADNSESSKS